MYFRKLIFDVFDELKLIPGVDSLLEYQNGMPDSKLLETCAEVVQFWAEDDDDDEDDEPNPRELAGWAVDMVIQVRSLEGVFSVRDGEVIKIS